MFPDKNDNYECSFKHKVNFKQITLLMIYNLFNIYYELYMQVTSKDEKRIYNMIDVLREGNMR